MLDAFLRAYARLQLTPSEGMLVIFLLTCKRDHQQHPQPSLAELGDWLGAQPRTVRNWARRLEKRGLLLRVMRRGGHKGEQTNLWDLTPLLERISEDRDGDLGLVDLGGDL